MKQKLFVDTNVLCAIYNPQDSQHVKAQKIIPLIQEYNPIVSNFILLETYTILSQRISKNFAIDFGNGVYKDHVFTVIWISRQIEDDTWRTFTSIKDKNFSYVDASILAVIRKERITHLISFDEYFKKLEQEFKFNLLGV